MLKLKKKIKAAVGGVAGATGVYAREFGSRSFVVAFHRVNDYLPADGLTCDSAKFDAFCVFFKKYFRVVPFAEQVAGAHAGQDLGGTLSITFDDGYLDNFEVAAPILRKHSLPAAFFVTTNFVGTSAVPPWDLELPQKAPWMSWDQIRSLDVQGFDIGCHTESHIDMGKADLEAIRRELSGSKARLERELGKPVKLFVYPFGGPENITERSLELVRESGFTSCASCHGGVNPRQVDPYRFKRIGVAEWFDSPHQFGAEILLGAA